VFLDETVVALGMPPDGFALVAMEQREETRRQELIDRVGGVMRDPLMIEHRELAFRIDRTKPGRCCSNRCSIK